MDPIVYLNGSLIPRSEARISPFDHGFLYGLGLFETVRAYGGIPFRLDGHIARLLKAAAIIGLQHTFTAGQLREACLHVLKANQLQEARLRLSLSAGPGEAVPEPPTGPPTLFITASQYSPNEALRLAGAKATFSALRRSSRSLTGLLKTASWIDNLIARREARAKGADEALFLNSQGMLCEGSASNIFLVLKDTVVTPSTSSGVLAGITRSAIIEIARTEGIETAEREVSPEDLSQAEEAFLTSSLVEVLPIIEVDGKPVGAGRPGPVTMRLAESYSAMVKAETSPQKPVEE